MNQFSRPTTKAEIPTPLVYVIGAASKLIGAKPTGTNAVMGDGNTVAIVTYTYRIPQADRLLGGTQKRSAESLQDDQ